MNEEKKLVQDKNLLFATVESKCHHIKVSEKRDEYLKVWVREPTWLEAEKALNAVMKIDAKNQNMDIDLNAMYKYMVQNFVEKTEPSLSQVDLLRLSPFIGTQLKEILPNPFEAFVDDATKKEE